MEIATSTGRKKPVSLKFYSVRIGHRPGIYNTWDECLAQVRGFKGATCKTLRQKYHITPTTLLNNPDKSFQRLQDAEQFLNGQDISTPAGTRGSAKKFYAVKSGKLPGIYHDWPSAQKQILGWPRPRHKCFATYAEAQSFLEQDEVRIGHASSQAKGRRASHEDESIGSPNKKPKITNHLSEASGSPSILQHVSEDLNRVDSHSAAGAEDGFDQSLIMDSSTGKVLKKSALQMRATKLRAVGSTANSLIRIHTDGSALGNGREGAFAGIGVYFGPNDQRNVSEPLPGQRQTNQRAELTAIQRAVDAVPKDRHIEIITDSQYAIKCVTEWAPAWRTNGWRTSAGKPVENKDLVEAILQRLAHRQSTGASTTFTWTKGHAGNEGNIAADKLAVEGARAAAELSVFQQ